MKRSEKKLRKMVAETLALNCNLNAGDCELSDIGQALNDAHGSIVKLNDRIRRSDQVIGAKVEEAVATMRREIEELQAKAKHDADMAAETIGALKRRASQAEADSREVGDRLAYWTGKRSDCEQVIVALFAFMQRPDAVLELFGQPLYQQAKDALAKAGYDVATLPMPKPVPPKVSIK